jgi:hypothetical protein
MKLPYEYMLILNIQCFIIILPWAECLIPVQMLPI